MLLGLLWKQQAVLYHVQQYINNNKKLESTHCGLLGRVWHQKAYLTSQLLPNQVQLLAHLCTNGAAFRPGSCCGSCWRLWSRMLQSGLHLMPTT